ncbi:MAG: uroporphyrinogen-III C-methyltransferase [Deltaproteobacteria bacterium]|nr:uroporphyrinogen-III C-methyltransferase [Deltaproteobacteria bacterium]
MLELRAQRCLVVGGGGVALRKVEGLLAEGAVVTVVAPEPMAALEELAGSGQILLERRPYRPGEAAGFALVFAATDERETNRQASHDARARGIWVNVADDPDLCSFQLPARVRRGALQLIVASAGKAPFAARRLRQLLERRFGPEWAEWIEAAARFRRAVRRLGLPPAERESLYDGFFAASVDEARLCARVPTAPEQDELLGPPAAATPAPAAAAGAAAGERGARAPSADAGLVSLVGAGPGDPGLLTLRGRRRLLAADAVVYDRLAAGVLPTELAARVALHCVGKEAGHHPVPQEEISALCVRLARQGKRVVRLKGGDPYVFGRGGEEVLALSEAGIPFEVVPGVTAGFAVAGYAGIPVTHRREAVRVTIVTAHEAVKSGGPQVRWDLLAADPHATLVGYMGVASLPAAVAALLAAGLDPDTPAAMIERGTTAAQRVVRAAVARLPEEVVRAGLGPPALFVIGPTVRHAAAMDWRSRLPLASERLALVAPAGALGLELELGGAELVELPLPVTAAARAVLGASTVTGVVLHDAAEVDALEEEREAQGWGPGVVAWCLSEDAAQRASALGYRRVELVPGGAPGGRLVEAMAAAAAAANVECGTGMWNVE